MKKGRINILIVEDDVTQGKALYEAFQRDGYNVQLCTTSVQGITLAQRQEFQCLIVDCMLPKMNGVDLVTEIVAMVPNKPKIILITGIFKDRDFTKEAMKTTGADLFLTKPLDLPAVIAQVETLFAGTVDDDPPILEIYSSQPISDANLVKLIERESTIHAFHLPKLYQRILDSNLSGELSLISAEGDLSSATFYHGKVASVKTPDKDSYFGSLAVSFGFVSAQDVIDALKDPKAAQLGTKLVESMSLSPHAVDVILVEQMALRLSQTIHEGVVTLKWTSQDLPKPDMTLEQSKFESLVEDWLESKLTADWVKSTLMSWGQIKIEGEYHPLIRGGHALRDVFSDNSFREDRDPQEIFRALVRGRAFLSERLPEAPNFSFLEARLDQMAQDFKLQNFFQILGVSEKSAAREVLRSFEGFKEAFDPEGLPPQCPEELREKAQRVFAILVRARDTLASDVERLRYLQQLSIKRSQEILEAEPLFRTAVLEVMTGHPKEAGRKFQKLIDSRLEFKDLRAYRIWAGLKEDRNYSAIRLDQIAPEERHSAAYMMAKGISYRIKGAYKKSLDAFRTAHMLDPKLTSPRSEIKILLGEMEKNRSQYKHMIKEALKILETLPRGRGAA